MTQTSSLVLLLCAVPSVMPAPPAQNDFFEARIRPVLVANCLSCHGPTKQQAELRLDNRTGFLKGSDNGLIVVPGEPEKSSLLKVLSHDGDIKMPPKKKLSAAEIADFSAWVKMGAPWPATETVRSGVPTPAEARSKHWAFRPVSASPPPPIRNPKVEIRNPVDSFVQQKLEATGIGISPEAARQTLVRRVTFDLIGLPPTPEEMEAAVNDPEPAWYEKVVERLLASPHHGERWGRHWLDVARYADTKGYVFTEERRFPFAYTYRDYVIRAFNEDLPYDQFIVHQLAADRLDLGTDPRPLAAMGFLTLGRRFLNNTPDIIDDRIDVTMRGLQGLTVGCARCHDHKFEPIPSKDYYSLYGVFASSIEPKELPTIAPPVPTLEHRDYEQKLAKLQHDVEDFRKKHEAELTAKNRKFRDELKALQKKVDALKASHTGAPPSAMVLHDAPNLFQPYVFLRGNPGNRGETVPRRFVEVIAGKQRQPFKDGSGRLELARAIASADNPLTARVMVNRVWQHYFGTGLVRTPSDFGLRGEPPSHPELLDWLANRFVADGWSLKQLHRTIVLSHAYRQASDERDDLKARDPENRLLGRQNRRRLEFEPLRDALLAVSDRFDRRMGGAAVDLIKHPAPPRRAIYGFIDRQNLPGVLRTFDLASPDTHTPQRFETTVPQQALFLLNHPFVVEQVRALAGRADLTSKPTPEARIDHLYRLLFGRAPNADELALARSFLAADEKKEVQNPLLPTMSAWERYVQVLLLSNEFAFID